MFKPLMIEDRVIDNYTIDKNGVVINKKGLELKRSGTGYRLFVDKKHATYSIKDLIKWSFDINKRYLDTTEGSYISYLNSLKEAIIDLDEEEMINSIATIIDPKLYDIDPNSNFLSDDTKVRIINECKINPWYFFRRVVGIEMCGFVYTSVKAALSNVDAYLQGPDLFDYVKLRNSIITYNILFGRKDVCVMTKERYRNNNEFMSLPEDHWLYSIKEHPNLQRKLLFTLKTVELVSRNFLDNVLYISCDVQSTNRLFSYGTGEKSLENINILSMNPVTMNKELEFDYLLEQFETSYLYGSTHLMRTAAKNIVAFPAIYAMFTYSSSNKSSIINNVIGIEGYSSFYGPNFETRYSDLREQIIFKSFDESCKNYVFAKFRKSVNDFMPFAKRIIDNEMDIPQIDKMNIESAVGLFTVLREKIMKELKHAVAVFEPEDLIYLIFGTRNYKEINDRLKVYDMYERHIMCSLYANNTDWSRFYNAPMPIEFTVESLLRKIY